MLVLSRYVARKFVKELSPSISKCRIFKTNRGFNSTGFEEKAQVFERIRRKVDSFEFFLDSKKFPSLKEAFAIQISLHNASIASGDRDVNLEHKVKRLVQFARAQKWYAEDGNRKSLLLIHLMCISNDIRDCRTQGQVEMVHALSIKLNHSDPEWVTSKLMGLYESNGERDLLSAVKLFLDKKDKGEVVYNQMIMLYGHSFPDKVNPILGQMIVRGITPSAVTFKGILAALSLSANDKAPKDALRLVESMRKIGVKPHAYHYGALVDLLARKGDVSGAVKILKEVPLSRDQQSFNAVLSRCIMIQKAEETKEDMVKKIDAAQDLVDFLDKEKVSYGVLMINYVRLAALGLKWPEGVRLIEEPKVGE